LIKIVGINPSLKDGSAKDINPKLLDMMQVKQWILQTLKRKPWSPYDQDSLALREQIECKHQTYDCDYDLKEDSTNVAESEGLAVTKDQCEGVKEGASLGDANDDNVSLADSAFSEEDDDDVFL
jgi:hypothetical protein